MTRRMRYVGVALVMLAACTSHGPQQVGAQPSWRSGTAHAAPLRGPVTLAPAGQAALRYNEPLETAPHTPLNDAVAIAVRDAATRAGLPAPAADARMFRACAELAAVVPEEGIIAYSLIEFALQRNGMIEPSPHLLVVWGDVDSPAVIVEQLQPRLAEILGDGATARFGVGAAKRNADGSGAVVFALQGSSVATAPIPRVAPAGGTVTIDAVVDTHYSEPGVFVTHDDGVMQRLELEPGRSNGFVARMRCGARKGRQQVEITASGTGGSTVLANFPVWCATQPPGSVTYDPSRDDAPPASVGDAERRLFASINHDRAAAGLAVLAWDDRVAGVARKYADEMQRTHVVAHVSSLSGSVVDRARAADVRAAALLENVARAYGVNEAHQALMNSPGHRANIMSDLATHIGVGVAFGAEMSGQREMFIAQVFIRVPPKIDPKQAIATVTRKVVAARTLVSDASLARVAQELAELLAAGTPREQARAALKAPLAEVGKQYRRLGSVVTATGDLEALDGKALLADEPASDVGIGVAQGPHPDFGDNAIWIVLLLASR